jgi:diguanylate cyclase (GGDEF)-like protein
LSDLNNKTKKKLINDVNNLNEHVISLENKISELQNTIKILHESDRQSRSWLEYSPVCTKKVDLDLNLQYMSSAGIDRLHIDNILPYYGKPYPLEFYPLSFRQKMNKNLEKVKNTGKVITQEAAVVDLDGNEVWFHSTLVPVNNDDNLIDYIIIVSIDITERKQAESNLHQLNAELEIRVNNRTLELEDANLRLKRLSETDHLTQIANRRAYKHHLNENIIYAKRAKQHLSLLMIDIDFFKQYNDKYGHDNGDITLRTIAEIIAKTLPRKTDFVARFGGEEFVVLLPSTASKGAFSVAENIRNKVKSLAIPHDESTAANVVTVSIGLTSLQGAAINKVDLLKQADSSLYIAKNSGRNSCHIFSR